MPRRNTMQVAIENAVLDVIPDEALAADRQARKVARQREAEIAA